MLQIFGLDNSVYNKDKSGYPDRWGDHEYWHLQAIEITKPENYCNLIPGYHDPEKWGWNTPNDNGNVLSKAGWSKKWNDKWPWGL